MGPEITPPPEPLWTVREAANFLRLGRNTVYEWAASGKLPSLRLGSRIRFLPRVLRRWAAVQEVEATALVAGVRRLVKLAGGPQEAKDVIDAIAAADALEEDKEEGD